MTPQETAALFDQQAANYDAQWEKTAPIRECLFLLLDGLFADLPDDARILCVGVGTGVELAHLAQRHPGWRFSAVEPSGRMLDACRARAEREGFASRCVFHEGFVETFTGPHEGGHDAATCFLVSQFLLDPEARTRFFRDIADRLKPGGLLASSDLSADTGSPEFDVLLPAWMRVMSKAGVTPEGLERMRTAYTRDVAVLPPARVEALLGAAGYETPTVFFQAGLIRGWRSRKPS
jgi:tRNA (cmo5U34)-methyltransferase